MTIQAAFDKAVQIVKELPADGPVKPTQDEQLEVRYFAHHLTPSHSPRWGAGLINSSTASSSRPTRVTTPASDPVSSHSRLGGRADDRRVRVRCQVQVRRVEEARGTEQGRRTEEIRRSPQVCRCLRGRQVLWSHTDGQKLQAAGDETSKKHLADLEGESGRLVTGVDTDRSRRVRLEEHLYRLGLDAPLSHVHGLHPSVP